MNAALLKTDLLLVGCGKMGKAILEGMLKSRDVPEKITVIEPNKASLASFERTPNIQILSAYHDMPAGYNPSIILFAIKPQMARQAISQYKKFRSSLFISILAGTTLKTLESCLSDEHAIVRAMPNLPATVGEGITAMVGNAKVTEAEYDLAGAIFRTTGQAKKFDSESVMDAVTAISGSGPAYLYYFMECWIKAAMELGISKADSELLVSQTIKGSYTLASQNVTSRAGVSIEHLVELRKAVTSPGGTTEAALNIFMRESGGLASLMEEALKSAEKRGKELNSSDIST